jgi:hypothetical protein
LDTVKTRRYAASQPLHKPDPDHPGKPLLASDAHKPVDANDAALASFQQKSSASLQVPRQRCVMAGDGNNQTEERPPEANTEQTIRSRLMKTRSILLLTAALTLISAPLANAGTNAPKPEVAAHATAPAPEFERFLVRLQSCKGMIPALSQWLKVLKPTLQDLGYSEEQLKQIKTVLCKNTVTLADARLFSERWLARHREQVSPNDIYEFLRRGKTVSEPVELAAN